jgi:iron(III) transport system substrate-binding protein
VRLTVILARGAMMAALAAALLASSGQRVAQAQLTVSDAQWNKIVAAAKEEGQVIVWGETGEARRLFRKDAFEKANPGIKVDLFQAARAAERDTRFLREMQAGVAKVDVMVGGSAGALGIVKAAGGLQPVKPYLRNRILDPKVWTLGQPLWMDFGHEYMLISDYWAYPLLTVNAQVTRDSVATWDDLLDPKYDGKIVMLDPRSSGIGLSFGLFVYYHELLGPDYFRRLFAHGRVVFNPDERQNAEWVDSGKMLMAFVENPTETDALQKLGSKIYTVAAPKAKGKAIGNVSSTDGILFIPNLHPLPHPNAMMVYVNWFYSQAGQQAMVDIQHTNSYRNDVDAGVVPSFGKRHPGIDYTNMNDERFVAGPSLQKMREALTAAINASN